jgi:ubiquitin-protein ligase E3 C
VFCKCYNNLLDVMDDDEFFMGLKPFSLQSNVVISSILKDLVFRMYWNGCRDYELRKEITSTVTKLRQRDSRRVFCPKNHWIINATANLDFTKYSGREFIEIDEQDEREEGDVEMEHQDLNTQRYVSLRDSMIQSQSPLPHNVSVNC